MKSVSAIRYVVAGIAVFLALAGIVRADCPPLPPPYAGPIFDADVQTWNPSLDGLFSVLPGTGVKRIALYANSHAGGSATVSAVLAARQAHPDLVVAGVPKIGFVNGGDLPPDYVSSTLASVADGTDAFIGCTMTDRRQ
jgi:hypothetical protein